MDFKIGDNMLVSTNDWFLAPDGESYRAVFGKVKGIHTAEETLGVQTNKHSTNWYLEIGNMVVAGCQIYYAIRSDTCDFKKNVRAIEHEGKINFVEETTSRIYDAGLEEFKTLTNK